MSNQESKLLYKAAKSGDLEKVKHLLSRGVGTEYNDEVSYFLIVIHVIFI